MSLCLEQGKELGLLQGSEFRIEIAGHEKCFDEDFCMQCCAFTTSAPNTSPHPLQYPANISTSTYQANYVSFGWAEIIGEGFLPASNSMDGAQGEFPRGELLKPETLNPKKNLGFRIRTKVLRGQKGSGSL